MTCTETEHRQEARKGPLTPQRIQATPWGQRNFFQGLSAFFVVVELVHNGEKIHDSISKEKEVTQEHLRKNRTQTHGTGIREACHESD